MPGRGRGKGRGKRTESQEERRAREEKQETERKKYKLIEFVKENPCLYDTAHPEHLNKAVTSVLWAEIAAILEEDGEYL